MNAPTCFDLCVRVRPGQTVEEATNVQVPAFSMPYGGRVTGYMPVGVSPQGEALLIVRVSNALEPYAPLAAYTVVEP
jgi:hypothetical protein